MLRLVEVLDSFQHRHMTWSQQFSRSVHRRCNRKQTAKWTLVIWTFELRKEKNRRRHFEDKFGHLSICPWETQRMQAAGAAVHRVWRWKHTGRKCWQTLVMFCRKNGAGGHCVASLQQETSENLWFSDVSRCKVAVSRSNFKPKGSPESSEYDD